MNILQGHIKCRVSNYNNVLMVFFAVCGSGIDQRKSMMFRSTDGSNFGEPVSLNGLPEGYFLWHMQSDGNRLYGSAYGRKAGIYDVILCASDDGVNWEYISAFPVPGNEVFIDIDRDGKLWALIRDERFGHIPTLCSADPPYTRFRSITRLPIRLQGPMVKRLQGGCVIVCRQWDPPGRRNLRTELFWVGDGGEIQSVRSLPSGGDTSYAGWLDLDTGKAILSYYSSHEYKIDEPHARVDPYKNEPAQAEHSTPADIFIADISYQ